MPRPLRVFLCHSSKDKAAVRELYQTLRAETWIDAWLDEEKLLPGQDWHEEIEKAVEVTDVVIVLLSKQSVSQEGYVQRELKLALDVADEKPENTIFIIPLRLDDCPAPRRLRGWHYVDYFPANRKPWVMERLLASLKVRAETLGIKTTVKEEPKKEIPTLGISEVLPQTNAHPESKFTQQKPFTKLLEPSALSLQKTPLQGNAPIANVSLARKPIRWFGVGGIILLAFILGGFGLNYLANNSPVPTATISPTYTVTPKPPTFTSMSFTPIPTPIKTLTSTPTEAPPPTPTLGIGSTWIRSADGMEMVYVPEGEFTMGGNTGNEDEKPVHQVYLDTYWIDRTEVTNAMYALCVQAGNCKNPATSVSSFKYGEYPISFIHWDDAQSYCLWAEVRLPTEAEWEKAARGTDGRIYPWGDNKNLTKFYLYSPNNSFPVGSFPSGASPYGVLDIAGGVREWVNDWYNETYYQNSPESNPRGPDKGEYHVLRGGYYQEFSCLGQIWSEGGVAPSSDRNTDPSIRYCADPYNNIGFRCARSAE